MTCCASCASGRGCNGARRRNPEELTGDASGFAGGGDAGAVSGIVQALASLPLIIGGTVQMGFTTEYDLVRRGQLLADVIPTLLDALIDLYEDRRVLLAACNDPSLFAGQRATLCQRARWVQDGRPIEPGLLIAPQVDDSLALEGWVERLRLNAGARGPSGYPPQNFGGNIRDTQRILGRLFDESLYLLLIPPVVLLAQSGSHLTAQQAVRAAVTTVFRARSGLGYVYGADPDAQDGRIPRAVRDAVLATLVDLVAAGLSPSLIVPSWAVGYRVDGSDAPPIPPTLGAWLLATDLVASGRWPLPDPGPIRTLGGLGVGGPGGVLG